MARIRRGSAWRPGEGPSRRGVLLGEAVEGDMRKGADKLQVPDDGQRLRRSREALPYCSSISGELVMHRQEERGSKNKNHARTNVLA